MDDQAKALPSGATPAVAAPRGIDDMRWTLMEIIASHRFNLTSEKRMQTELQELLPEYGIEAEREVRLGPRDVVDFLLPGGVAVECKLKGMSKRGIYRQLRRYAASPRVSAIILISNVAMGLPPEIEGKPAYFMSLGAAWL